jgi:hypothetical protein
MNDKKANPLTARYSPVAAAAAAQVLVVELSAAEREAALKLPIKQAIRECGPAIAAQVADELQLALVRARGGAFESAEELGAYAGRITLHPDAEVEEGQRGEVYVLDGEHPLLWVGPVLIERIGEPGDESLRASRPVYHFQPPLPQENEAANDAAD